MFPPIDEAVLQQNPDFATLYHKLTTVVLNPDGTTKDDGSSRDDVSEELNTLRLETAKHHLIKDALLSLTPDSSSTPMPEPLKDLILLLPSLLDPPFPLPPSTTSLLLSTPPLSNLEDLLPLLATHLSSHLHDSALSLTRIANPTKNPSYLHRTIPTLPTQIKTLQSEIQSLKSALLSSRLAAENDLRGITATANDAFPPLIRALEAKHGVIARSLEISATEAALQAKKVERDASDKVESLKGAIYTDDVVAALSRYESHLRREIARLEDGVREREDRLRAYGVAGEGEGDEGRERMFREMGRVYGEMEREMEGVKGELERLGR